MMEALMIDHMFYFNMMMTAVFKKRSYTFIFLYLWENFLSNFIHISFLWSIMLTVLFFITSKTVSVIYKFLHILPNISTCADFPIYNIFYFSSVFFLLALLQYRAWYLTQYFNQRYATFKICSWNSKTSTKY